MVETTNEDDNTIKWASIPLIIPEIFRMPKEKRNVMLFNTQVYASVKYDGTNIGRDTTGLMYGRNKVIKAGTKSYQKTPLASVEKIDTEKIFNELIKITSLHRDTVKNFVVYAELMCNKDLFDYNDRGLFGTCPIFGAMIKPASTDAVSQITKTLGESGFACMIRSDKEEEEES